MSKDYESEYESEEEAKEFARITALFMKEFSGNPVYAEQIRQIVHGREEPPSARVEVTQWLVEFMRRFDFLLTIGCAAVREDLRRGAADGLECALSIACCIPAPVISTQIDNGQFSTIVRELLAWVYEHQLADAHKPVWFQTQREQDVL